MKLIIDAISNGSGGAKRHLSELLSYTNYNFCEFTLIEVWGPKSLLDYLPDNSKIIKKSHKLLDYGVIGFSIFNFFLKRKSFNKNYDIIFSPFGNFTHSLHPYVSMSQNMLMFEKNERRRFKLGFLRLKLKFLFFVNKKSFENADGLIFLSKYAKDKINSIINLKSINQLIINHGISKTFLKNPSKHIFENNSTLKFLYVSNVLPYKHHIKLVESIIELNKEGHNISLTLVGENNYKKIGKKINSLISSLSNSKIIEWNQKVGLDEVRKYYHSADFFIFSSSCENMPNVLIEAMSSGLPILCSNFQPMPEFLKKGGIYFDPLSKKSIKQAVQKVLSNQKLASEIAQKSFDLSKQYSWKICSENTFRYLHDVSKKYNADTK